MEEIQFLNFGKLLEVQKAERNLAMAFNSLDVEIDTDVGSDDIRYADVTAQFSGSAEVFDIARFSASAEKAEFMEIGAVNGNVQVSVDFGNLVI